MVTFARGHWTAKTTCHNAKVLANLDREAGGISTAPGTVRWTQDPVDLRGLPAIGRGVAGAIRGTRPGDRLEQWRRDRLCVVSDYVTQTHTYRVDSSAASMRRTLRLYRSSMTSLTRHVRPYSSNTQPSLGVSPGSRSVSWVRPFGYTSATTNAMPGFSRSRRGLLARARTHPRLTQG